jgi:hypothetical protein
MESSSFLLAVSFGEGGSELDAFIHPHMFAMR